MKNKIVELLSNSIEQLTKEEINNLIEIPPKSEMGDYAFPCFILSKIFKKAPPVIASEVCEKLNKMDFLSRIEVQGAYINFFVDKNLFVEQVINKFDESDNYGFINIGENKIICIDYSSPNVAKNFHVGHLRTTIIGNSLYKIYSKLGYKVERINHLGDWGTQFGKLIVAYKKWGSKEEIEKNGVSELMKIYIKFHDEAKNNPELDNEARKWFTSMENGNEEALDIWRWFRDISLKEYLRVYDILGIEFDSYAGESFYNDKMQVVINELKEKDFLIESDGAQIVNLEEYNMAPCLITKNDGSSLYATRDLAAAIYRKNTYNFDKCIYVTGLEQNLHFAQWFKVIEIMGYDWFDKLVHVPYGLVSLPEGKVSTRSGNIIYAEDILNESIQKIKAVIEKNNSDVPNKEEVMKKVGVGAIIFNDLYNQRIKNVVFNWDKILNSDGETGPYVQYTYARASSILRNVQDRKIGKVVANLLIDDASINLLKEINRYEYVIQEAANRLEPSVIARYTIAIAQAFNKFYQDNKVNVEDVDVRTSRLKLVSMTRYILKDSLSLLGIDTVEQM